MELFRVSRTSAEHRLRIPLRRLPLAALYRDGDERRN
jgi:hypothetical protein